MEVILSNPKYCILLTELLNAGQPQGDDVGDDGELEKWILTAGIAKRVLTLSFLGMLPLTGKMLKPVNPS